MIYILSDIHGNRRRFASIMEQIPLREEDTLYVLGDVIDRHPDGISILLQLMAMPNVKLLLGNHEYMMLRTLGRPKDSNVDDGKAQSHWYRNGGQVTHEQFKQLDPDRQEALIRHLLSLPLHYDVELNGTHYKLVHGATEEAYDQDPKHPTPAHFAVWKRWDLEDTPPEGYTMIFGHTPTRYYRDIAPMEVWFDRNRIGIDCGCGYSEDPADELYHYGRLACLRLDDGQVFYSQEGNLT